MEAFKEAWFAIDTRARGEITSDDLSTYMKQQNYDESFVRKWMRLFDSDNSGTISLDEFCDVLGLNSRDILAELNERYPASSALSQLPEGFIHVSGDMEDSYKLLVAKVVQDALAFCERLRDVPKRIKTVCDEEYGQLWHVVITQGQFWCYYGHEPRFSWVFQVGKQVFIIYKTPG